MGTLYNQSPRRYNLVECETVERHIEWAAEVAKKHKVPVSDIIEMKKVLEMERQITLSVYDGDAWDEQIGGIGDLIKEFMDFINESMESGLLSSVGKIFEKKVFDMESAQQLQDADDTISTLRRLNDSMMKELSELRRSQ